MRAVSLGVRLIWIVGVLLAALGRGAWRALRSRGRGGAAVWGTVLAEAMQRLGATFIKFGQILSTRPDLLGPEWTGALGHLQDRVAAAPFEVVERVLRREWAEAEWGLVAWVEPTPVAAASVAQVHRAVLRDGGVIALKVQRPEAARHIELDLTLLAVLARVANWLPALRMLSLPGAVARFAESMRAQLDFAVEAANNRRFAANFRDDPHVRVPRLVEALCTPHVLAMEFVEGVRATEPEKVGGDRPALARVGLGAILKMVFLDGFVHADLHPGNILLTDKGSVVLLDLGLVAEVDPTLMRPYVETFMALARQDGPAAARLFYVYAPDVGVRDYRAYERDMNAHFGGLAGKLLGEVETRDVLAGIMNILRRHRVRMDPAFTVVHVALVVAEGLGKQLDPSIDAVQLAVPTLFSALVSAPPGRPPYRDVPQSLCRIPEEL